MGGLSIGGLDQIRLIILLDWSVIFMVRVGGWLGVCLRVEVFV